MSEKISMEKLLPIALELYKTVPPLIVQNKPLDKDEKQKYATEKAEDFAIFCHHLRKKLEGEE